MLKVYATVFVTSEARPTMDSGKGGAFSINSVLPHNQTELLRTEGQLTEKSSISILS
jgi:hypothetical protein